MGERSSRLLAFIRESNRIEGVLREPSDVEIGATEAFLALPQLTVPDVCNLVQAYQPGEILRDQAGLNVRVGSHVAPAGGPEIRRVLEHLLDAINLGDVDAYQAHVMYETLHPFTDGNGRSGRAIWLWQMGEGGLTLGFLHRFYYQTLANSEAPT